MGSAESPSWRRRRFTVGELIERRRVVPRGRPELGVFVAHERIQLVRKFGWQMQHLDHSLNITQVGEATRIRHAACKLQVDQPWQLQTRYAVQNHTGFSRVWKHNGFWPSVAGIIPRR